MAPRVRLTKQSRRSAALLLRRVPYRDSDLIVQLLTELDGAVSAIARGARRSQKRFSALEPLHTLSVEYEISESRELATLTSAQLTVPRVSLTTSLAKMDAAGRGLRWVRRAAARHCPEPRLWREVNQLLDGLAACDDAEVSEQLAVAGLRILEAAGWALELAHCVRCGKQCPDNARVRIDVAAGGVVCRSCGAVGIHVSSAQRLSWMAATEGSDQPIDAKSAELAIDLVARALEAHGRGEAT
jgi:DNA repair protein RecO (recombination protein O)